MAYKLLKALEVVAISVLFVILQNWANAKPQVPCYFIFGDSLSDNGNNNYLRTLARVNYSPYGIDFPRGPTGRFSNGKNMQDFIGFPFSIFSIFSYYICVIEELLWQESSKCYPTGSCPVSQQPKVFSLCRGFVPNFHESHVRITEKSASIGGNGNIHCV